MTKPLKNKQWSPLQTGDLVDVIAPGYASSPEEVEGALQFLQQWGLRSHWSKTSLQKHFLHANSDEKRFHFLKQALLNKNSKVIWCMRGGYGSNRLLPYLEKTPRPSHVKLLIGISDITSLHVFLNQKWGWPTLHGPLLDRLGRDLIAKKHQQELKKILWGQDDTITFSGLKPLNAAALKTTHLRSEIVGGNWVVLGGHMGTRFQVDTKNKFIFLEEIGERAYRIDRLIEQFSQAGLWNQAKAIFLGDFTHGQEPDGSHKKLPQVVKRWAADLKTPLFSGLPAGHGAVQRPVPMHTKAVLSKSSTGSFHLTIDTGVLLS